MTRQRIALILLPLAVLLVLISYTGWAADDRVFYGLIGLYVLSQIAWLAYVFKRQRQEEYTRKLGQLFPND